MYCADCGSEKAILKQETETHTYKKHQHQVLVDFYECPQCGEEFVPKECILTNEMRVRAAKKEIDGLLSAEEITKIRKQLGLTQIEAAQVFGGGQNAFSKYERNEVSQSVSMDKLLRLCSKNAAFFRDLLQLSNVPHPY